MSATGLWGKMFALISIIRARATRFWLTLLLLGSVGALSPQLSASETALASSMSSPQSASTPALDVAAAPDIPLGAEAPVSADSNTTPLGLAATPMGQTPHRQVGSSDSYPKVIASLLMVVGLILLLAWLTKRFKLPIAGQGPLQVIASLPLSAKERLLVVQVGQQQLLLSSGQHGTRLLTPLDSPLPAANNAAFTTVLAKFNNKSSKEVSPGE